MAYLLSLNRDHILDAQAFFVDLPHTELYIQTALYYYSLELYKTLYTDCEKLYLYKPIDLIRHIIVAAQTMSEENEIVRAFRYWQNHLLDEVQIAKTEQTMSIDALELQQNIINKKENSEETRDAQHIDNIPVTNSDVSDQQKSTVSDEIDVEWTDDWGDFSDTEATDDKKNKNRSEEMEAISQDEVIAFEHSITECTTEEDRLVMFQRMFIRMNNLEDYTELKKLMFQWPKFSISDQVALNPVLRMMKAIIALITKTNMADFENKILREHEELIELLASKEVP